MYTPISIVRNTHKIVHLDDNLCQVSNNFGITYNSQFNSYTESLLPIPLLCFVIGMISVLLWQMSFCCPCYYHSNRHTLTEPMLLGDIPSTSEKKTRSSLSLPMNIKISHLYLAFYFFALIVIVSDQFLFMGNNFLTSGANNANDGLNYVGTTFDTLTYNGNKLLNEGNSIQYDLGNASLTCQYTSDLSSYFSSFDSYMNDYLTFVSPIPNKVQNFQDLIKKWAVAYKNKSVWAMYSITLISLIIYFLSIFFGSKHGLRCGIIISDIIVLILFIFCTIEMILLMGLADFCIEPTAYVVPLLPPGTITNITNYYISCEGLNPFASSIATAQELVTNTTNLLNEIIPLCNDNSYLEDALAQTQNMQLNFQAIANVTACPPTQNQLVTLLQNGICNDTFKGFFTIWLSQLICGLFLFFVTISIGLVYYYYGRYWNMDEESSALFVDDIYLNGSNRDANNSRRFDHYLDSIDKDFEEDSPRRSVSIQNVLGNKE
eukprot:gene5767-7963_t